MIICSDAGKRATGVVNYSRIRRALDFLTHKDINQKMLILVLLVLMVLAGVTAYYHSTLSELAGEYKITSTMLEDITGKLSVEESERFRSNREENSLRDSKRALEVKYSDLKNENHLLEEDAKTLRTELKTVKDELILSEQLRTTAETNFEILEERFKKVQNSLEERNDETSLLYHSLSRVCSKMKGAGLSDDSC